MTDTPFCNRWFSSAQKDTVFFLGAPQLRCAGPDRVTMWVIHTSFAALSMTSGYSSFQPCSGQTGLLLRMTRGTYKSEISTDSRKMPVTTDANVTNSPKSGNANQLYRMPPDPCGNYQHS